MVIQVDQLWKLFCLGCWNFVRHRALHTDESSHFKFNVYAYFLLIPWECVRIKMEFSGKWYCILILQLESPPVNTMLPNCL